jgi:hypothetical protein
VRVDDEWAHFLFEPNYPGNPYNFQSKIQEEDSNFSGQTGNGQPGLGYFYMDECQFNSFPCVAYVNRLIKNYDQQFGHPYQTGLFSILNKEVATNWLGHLKYNLSDDKYRQYLLSTNDLMTDIYFYENYPFKNEHKYPSNLPDNLSLPNLIEYERASTPSEYNNKLIYDCLESGGNMNMYRINGEMVKRINEEQKNVVFLSCIQAHCWESSIGKAQDPYKYSQREPTNEEINLQAYLSLIYGAKQVFYFIYYSDAVTVGTYTYHDYGLLNDNNTQRLQNYYGQYKWAAVKQLTSKLRAIGDYMYPEGHLEKHLIYDHSRTVNPVTNTGSGFPFLYINDIKSVYNFPSDYEHDAGCIDCDPDAYKYWEFGFFSPNPASPEQNDKSKYFIALNKRCTPAEQYVNVDKRTLSVKFNPSQLNGFNNWKIIDPLTNNTITTFDKNANEYVYVGVFEPGEGKLFKLAPVMQDGGTFVCDEEFSDITVNCRGNVNSNSYNLLVGDNSTIEFNEDCGITAENCVKVEFNSVASTVKLIGKGNSKWAGIIANNVSEYVLLMNVEIRNVKSGWALTARNCNITAVQDSKFYLEDAEPGQTLSAVVVNNSALANTNEYLIGNEIRTKNTNVAVAIINSAETGGGGMIHYNTISTSGNGRVGMMLYNCIENSIYNNTFSGFKDGIQAYNSNLYFLNNNLTSSLNDSRGIVASTWSLLQLGNNNFVQYGSNTISNYGNNCMNLKVDHSMFFAWEGGNNFNVTNNTNSYNLYGNGQLNPYSLSPTLNCFNGPNGNAIYYLTDTLGNPLSLMNELPHQCNNNQEEDVSFVVTLPLNFKDTVYESSITTIQNPSYFQQLYFSFLANIIKRNYDSAEVRGIELLTNYSDSLFAPEIISKLYLAVIATDSSGIRVQHLKTFYELLIINHPQDVSLIKTANYYTQKCKVYLKQFESALIGFEDIIVQNPYSYEGLIASWDYAATILMIDTTLGSGGIKSSDNIKGLLMPFNEMEYLIDSLRANKMMKYDRYDKTNFTTADRKILYKTTGNVFIDERKKQIEIVKNLQEKIKTFDGRKDFKVKRELDDLINLNEVVKTKKPKSNSEYLTIINDDINKLLKVSTDYDNIENQSIPKTFELSQNYPNPFNPVTKINFDLPKDAKVKLVIYDILGREIKILVNNEFRTAGRYITEFNASNLASGIYFARILVNEGKDFMAVKKMILVK